MEVVSTIWPKVYLCHFIKKTHALLGPTLDLIQGSHQMRANLLHGSSKPCHSSNSSLLSIHFYHAYPSFLTPQKIHFHSTLFSHSSWTFSYTSHTSSYYSLHQPVLLHSLHMSKSTQNTLLCSILTPVLLRISFLAIRGIPGVWTPQTSHLHYIESLFSATAILHVSVNIVSAVGRITP